MTISPNSPAPSAGERSAPDSNHTLQTVFRILVLAAAGMTALLTLLPAAGHDQLWFLLMARRWLAGAQLYGPEAFDSNPPGIVWLSALPILLGRALHLPATSAAKLLVILLESATSLLSLYFLRKARGIRTAYEIPALLFAAFILFYLAPARDFGQRDHLLSFLVLPYVLAAAISPRTQRQALPRCLAGILAALGICLKPHHALIVLAVELSLLLFPSFFFPSRDPASQAADPGSQNPIEREATLSPGPWAGRPRLSILLRPETIFLAATGLLFLDAIHKLTPLYFTLALPILHDTYWAIGHLSLPALAFEAIELCFLAAISLTLFLRQRPRSPVIALLLIAGAAASLAYLVQGTGWYYQQLPAIAFFGAALTLQLLDYLAVRPRTIPAWLPVATAALCLLALALTAHFTNYPFTADRAFAIDSPDPALFRSLPPGTPIATLTTSVDAAMMPVERYHLTWAQRTNNLWLLPAILRNETPGAGDPPHRILSPSALAALDTLQHRWMVEDLTRWNPTLVLVQRCEKANIHCQELEDRDDDLLAWFLRDPAFATLWRNYTYQGAHGDFDVYTLTIPTP